MVGQAMEVAVAVQTEAKKFEELIRGRYLHFQVINDQAKPGKPGHRNK